MEHNFDYLKMAIPPDIYEKTKATISRQMAIFEPEECAVGGMICVDDYHFLLFISEAPVVRIGDVIYSMKKGDMLAIKPFDQVYGVSPSESKGKYISISVNKDFFQQIAAEAAGGKEFEFKRAVGRYSTQLLNLIGEFQLELMNYGEAYPQMVQAIATRLVFQIIRDINAERGGKSDKVAKDNQYIRKAIEFMQEHFQTSITINDICNLIYLSPCHFKRVFKEQTGKTPHQYLMDIRLEKAKELLERKGNTIEDIARMCGFVNAGHFAVTFKRNNNLPPSEYRKKHYKK